MKKILAILAVVFAASVATSCVEPFEYEKYPLTINNYDLTLSRTASKKGVNGENIHYFQITATGSWEATIVHQGEEIWCWLMDHYEAEMKDADGNVLKDEYGRILTTWTKVAEGVEFFPGGEADGKYYRIRGGAGVTYLPMQYNDNQGSVRYATLRVRRLDMDCEKFTNITQNK